MPLFGRGAPAAATYAAVLDGRHLWLEVEADGAVALREVGTKHAVEVGAGPFDLSELTGGAYDVVVGRSRVDAPARLRLSPLAPDGTTRWDLLSEGGRLRLVRTAVPPTAELDAVDVRGDRIHLRVRPARRVEEGCHLLLLDQDDTVLATLPVTAHDGLLEALIGLDDLPAGFFGMLRVAVGTDTGHVRVRRAGNDLADPNHAVLLPELVEGQKVRARLRWNPEGLLALRTLDGDG